MRRLPVSYSFTSPLGLCTHIPSCVAPFSVSTVANLDCSYQVATLFTSHGKRHQEHAITIPFTPCPLLTYTHVHSYLLPSLSQWLAHQKTCPQCRERCLPRNVLKLFLNDSNESLRAENESLNEQELKARGNKRKKSSIHRQAQSYTLSSLSYTPPLSSPCLFLTTPSSLPSPYLAL